MKTIYFIRHGESQANLEGVYAGWNDTPLTDKGRDQARKAAESAKHLGIQKIISSDLERAYETAKIVADDIGIAQDQIVKDERLRECFLGQLAGTPSKGLGGYLEYAMKKDNNMEVEYIKDIEARLQSLLSDIEKLPEKKVLLVGHNGSGLILESILVGHDKDLGELPKIPNGEVVTFSGGAL